MAESPNRTASPPARGPQEPCPWGEGKSKGARKRARRRAEAATSLPLKGPPQEPRPWGEGKSQLARKCARRRVEAAAQLAAQSSLLPEPSGKQQVRGGNAALSPAAQESAIKGPNAITFNFSVNSEPQPFGPPVLSQGEKRQSHTDLAPSSTGFAGLSYEPGPAHIRRELPVHADSIPSFGQPQKQATMLNQPRWVQGSSKSFLERCLQDLYLEHPEKRLRGIEPSTLYLVAQAIQQVADEAANNWHRTNFPELSWSDGTSTKYPDDAPSPELVSWLPSKIDALRVRNSFVVPLIRASKTMVSKKTTISTLVLCRIMDQCISICGLVHDDRRKVLLQKARERIEWLPVGLDCKKLDIQRRAIEDLEKLHESFRDKILFTGNPEILRFICSEDEMKILDRAFIEFTEHRSKSLIEIFQTLKQLLGATAWS